MAAGHTTGSEVRVTFNSELQPFICLTCHFPKTSQPSQTDPRTRRPGESSTFFPWWGHSYIQIMTPRTSSRLLRTYLRIGNAFRSTHTAQCSLSQYRNKKMDYVRKPVEFGVGKPEFKVCLCHHL